MQARMAGSGRASARISAARRKPRRRRSKQGDYGGWLCHCHGSQYDMAGRVRVGPAPRNLDVPVYAFLSDTRIKIG